MKERFRKVFATKTQEEWTEIFKGPKLVPSYSDAFVMRCSVDSDTCVEPVLTIKEAASHPHNRSVSSTVHYI